jgi:hypothetical protein
MNASSMCANCFGFLSPEGYCKKCRRISNAAPLQKEERVQRALKDESATDVGGNSAQFSYESDPKVIAALNRTTHAVRSLAIFLFTSLCTSLVGYGVIGAGANVALTCEDSYSDCGSGTLVFLGWGVIALGLILALGAGIGELGKSKP